MNPLIVSANQACFRALMAVAVHAAPGTADFPHGFEACPAIQREYQKENQADFDAAFAVASEKDRALVARAAIIAKPK